jgi:DNA-binding CsgD family transcriptional regulator
MESVDELKLTPDQTAMLIGLSDVLASGEVSLQELLTTVAASLAGFIGDACVISLLSPDRRWLRPLATADPDPEGSGILAGIVGATVPADRGYSRHVLGAVATLRLGEIPPDVALLASPQLSAYARDFGVAGAIIAPMRVQGRAIGQVMMLRRAGGPPYSPEDERFVQVLADWLGLAVQCGGLARIEPEPQERAIDLSEREGEVLRLLALGHTNREIAERLVLSVRTIEWHRARIQWKLGVTGRAALARVAREHGLAD